MSIHNHTEVREEETHQAQNFTRDRFGKKHSLSSQDGAARVRRLKKAVVLIFLMTGLSSPLWADSGGARKGPNTNIQINSSDLEPFSLDDKLNRMRHSKEEKAVIYKEGDSIIGFNEDGDPALTANF